MDRFVVETHLRVYINLQYHQGGDCILGTIVTSREIPSLFL